MAAQASLGSLVQSMKPPWTALVIVQEGQNLEPAVKAPKGFVQRTVRGAKCRSVDGLFTEMALALEFPDYFGHNWDALEECLTDLEWLPAKGYLLTFSHAESILPHLTEEFATLLEVLNNAGETWASRKGLSPGNQPTPFHSIFMVSKSEKSKLMHVGLPEVSPRDGRSSTKRRGFSG